MTVKNYLFSAAALTAIALTNACGSGAPKSESSTLVVHERSKVQAAGDSTAFTNQEKEAVWKPSETAIIVTDMWDQHWCKGATSRVAELAPFMNKVISEARSKGVLIVYAPSDCMNYYKDYAGRKAVLKYMDSTQTEPDASDKLPSEVNKPWPIDQSNEGCNDTPRCQQRSAWTKQIDALEITDKDMISDAGREIESMFKVRGIKNVILMGVHTNMCIIHRSFGLRNMTSYGHNVVLARDLTDAMYDSRQSPYVNHFAGVGLVIDYIEKYISPSILSTDITGDAPFHFSTDPQMLTNR